MSNLRAVELEWSGEGLVFEGRGTNPKSPAVTIDGDGDAGPSPMLTLLLAAGSCAASDVVLILKKMKQNLTALRVAVSGTRRDEDPKRYVSVRYEFSASGDLDRAKVERAVELSLEKYCSVIHTLNPDVSVSSKINLR